MLLMESKTIYFDFHVIDHQFSFLKHVAEDKKQLDNYVCMWVLIFYGKRNKFLYIKQSNIHFYQPLFLSRMRVMVTLTGFNSNFFFF